MFGSCQGAFAEYVCASEAAVAIKPENVSFEQAAAVPVAACTALQGLRDSGKVKPGQRVLINGAAGGVGTFAVQIAKVFGAHVHVTGVCNTRNVDMIRSLGADQVIDYTNEDFTKSGQRYDLIYDLVADRSLLAYRRALRPQGIYIGVGILGKTRLSLIGILGGFIAGTLLSWFVSQKFITFVARDGQEDLTIMAGLMAEGKVLPVIDRCYPLNETPAAISYMAERHAKGKVVITVETHSSSK